MHLYSSHCPVSSLEGKLMSRFVRSVLKTRLSKGYDPKTGNHRGMSGLYGQRGEELDGKKECFND